MKGLTLTTKEQSRIQVLNGVLERAVTVAEAEAPHIYAIIQLNEGPRMPSNLVECPIEDARIDMPVEEVFDDASDEFTLVKFRPV